jgi:transcriptional regulator with XRE-family HTH domain
MNLGKAQAALGKAIRTRREALEIAQDAFAASIDMHRAYYWSIESGRRNLSLRLLLRVADGLQTTAWQLIKDAQV